MREFPALEKLYRDDLLDAGIDIIGVSQFNTTKADTTSFVEENRLTFPNIYDPNSAIATAYGIRGVPSYVFLDKHGRIAHRSSGARGVQLIESVLNELAAE